MILKESIDPGFGWAVLRKSLSATRFWRQKWDQRCRFSLGRADEAL